MWRRGFKKESRFADVLTIANVTEYYKEAQHLFNKLFRKD